ncbi:MAG TPA: 23S rRNA (guanosine(2251)-2'-O)-methyltransferase RlmB [Polyangia bacterium]
MTEPPGDAAAAPETGPTRVVFGVRPVEEVCRARPRDVAVVYVAEGHKPGEIDRAITAAKDRAVAVEVRPRAFVASMAGRTATHQGIVAIVGGYRYATIDDMLAAAKAAGEAPLLMLLDGVTDPHNLGAVIRSAEVLGGHGVIIPERGAAPVNGTVVKASAGATERVAVARVGHLLGVVDFLRRAGVRVYATGAEGGTPLPATDLTEPVAFVLGSEGRGAREAVVRRCDGMVAIPQRGAIASLNVSVAGALLLYEGMRQRLAARGSTA